MPRLRVRAEPGAWRQATRPRTNARRHRQPFRSAPDGVSRIFPSGGLSMVTPRRSSFGPPPVRLGRRSGSKQRTCGRTSSHGLRSGPRCFEQYSERFASAGAAPRLLGAGWPRSALLRQRRCRLRSNSEQPLRGADSRDTAYCASRPEGSGREAPGVGRRRGQAGRGCRRCPPDSCREHGALRSRDRSLVRLWRLTWIKCRWPYRVSGCYNDVPADEAQPLHRAATTPSPQQGPKQPRRAQWRYRSSIQR